ncbi:MAG: 2-C-methyl-D-erythritol 4-phosphate cytidylyltransferase [Calditrichaeota bacterium]|nr:2-C-methyl-D-erythritol 4-phosphate cytidylyltransferase [Calditrichota bacterium]
MKSKEKKQMMMINNKPLFIHTLLQFENHPAIDEIILVCPSENKTDFSDFVFNFKLAKVKKIVDGGKERQDSVSNGLTMVDAHADIILVHDAVRPFISAELIESIIESLTVNKAAVIATTISNTVKRVHNGLVEATVDREQLWSVQTPQGMQAAIFRDCYRNVANESFIGTDEAMIAEHCGIPVSIVSGSKKNIKVTTPDDLDLVNFMMKEKHEN